MEFKIAETASDLNICYKLREIIFIIGQNVPVDRERDNEDSIATHFLLFDNSAPIGVGRIVPEGQTTIIGRIGILDEHRGKGAGLFLMQEIISYCKKQEFKKLTLWAQEHAVGFYKKLNFEICSEKHMNANIPHYKMRLEL